jgi:hypothetical protein
LMSLWRLEGTIKWILRTESSWGAMTRNASWSGGEQTPAAPAPASPPPAAKRKPKRKVAV